MDIFQIKRTLKSLSERPKQPTKALLKKVERLVREKEPQVLSAGWVDKEGTRAAFYFSWSKDPAPLDQKVADKRSSKAVQKAGERIEEAVGEDAADKTGKKVRYWIIFSKCHADMLLVKV